MATLSAASYHGRPQDRGFTLELFFRAPDTYLLRGRGALGVVGFRALLQGDSLTLLINRQKRGYQGRTEDFPDPKTREMWELLRSALPWITGTVDLKSLREGDWQLQFGAAGRPRILRAHQDDVELVIEYGRYRGAFPFWHLRTVKGRTPTAQIELEIRQQLYNTPLDSGLFALELPAFTRPLTD